MGLRDRGGSVLDWSELREGAMGHACRWPRRPCYASGLGGPPQDVEREVAGAIADSHALNRGSVACFAYPVASPVACGDSHRCGACSG